LSIAISNRSKVDVLRAISETIEGIGEPLNEYLSSNPERYRNLIDVPIDKETIFDILIDKDQLTRQSHSNQVSDITLSSNTISSSISDNEEASKDTTDLVESTKEYGTIIAKIINGRISKEIVKSFQEAVLKYISLTRNKVGLALIIGDDIDAEADNLSKLIIKGIDYFILIEK
jgi:hypothetical protein